jgi:hypothetical protein
MVSDDGNDPVVVRRAVYDAGIKLRAEFGGDRMQAMERAQEKVRECKAAGDETGAAFWNSAWSYLMDAETARAGYETIILEEGESYDADEGEVIT